MGKIKGYGTLLDSDFVTDRLSMAYGINIIYGF
jgi:hypothetical protein